MKIKILISLIITCLIVVIALSFTQTKAQNSEDIPGRTCDKVGAGIEYAKYWYQKLGGGGFVSKNGSDSWSYLTEIWTMWTNNCLFQDINNLVNRMDAESKAIRAAFYACRKETVSVRVAKYIKAESEYFFIKNAYNAAEKYKKNSDKKEVSADDISKAIGPKVLDLMKQELGEDGRGWLTTKTSTNKETKEVNCPKISNDLDGDGLSDEEEKTKYKTDQGKADTDGGGISDCEEVNRGKNPLDASDDQASVEEYFAEFMQRYKERFPSYVNGGDCKDPVWEEVVIKWKEVKDAFTFTDLREELQKQQKKREIRKAREKKIKEMEAKAKEGKKAKSSGGFMGIVNYLDDHIDSAINGLPAKKGLEDILTEMKENTPHWTNPTITGMQQAIQAENNSYDEAVQNTTEWATYDFQYQFFNASIIKDFKEIISGSEEQYQGKLLKEGIIQILKSSESTINKVEKCSGNLNDQQCSN